MGCCRKSGDGGLMKFDQLPTPCYVIDEGKLRDNLSVLKKAWRTATDSSNIGTFFSTSFNSV